MRNGNSTTYELQLCDVLFPPGRPFQFGIERGQEVVTVHDDVHEAVQQSQQSGVASFIKFRVKTQWKGLQELPATNFEQVYEAKTMPP